MRKNQSTVGEICPLVIVSGTQCAKPNKSQPAHRRYFSPVFLVVALKTTWHRGKFPEASRHSAQAHKISGSRTFHFSAPGTFFFSKDVSYSGLNTRSALATSARQEKRAQSRFFFAHCWHSQAGGTVLGAVDC